MPGARGHLATWHLHLGAHHCQQGLRLGRVKQAGRVQAWRSETLEESCSWESSRVFEARLGQGGGWREEEGREGEG